MLNKKTNILANNVLYHNDFHIIKTVIKYRYLIAVLIIYFNRFGAIDIIAKYKSVIFNIADILMKCKITFIFKPVLAYENNLIYN